MCLYFARSCVNILVLEQGARDLDLKSSNESTSPNIYFSLLDFSK